MGEFKKNYINDDKMTATIISMVISGMAMIYVYGKVVDARYQKDEDFWGLILCIFIASMGLAIIQIIGIVKSKLTLYENGVEFSPVFGEKTSVTWDQVTFSSSFNVLFLCKTLRIVSPKCSGSVIISNAEGVALELNDLKNKALNSNK